MEKTQALLDANTEQHRRLKEKQNKKKRQKAAQRKQNG